MQCPSGAGPDSEISLLLKKTCKPHIFPYLLCAFLHYFTNPFFSYLISSVSPESPMGLTGSNLDFHSPSCPWQNGLQPELQSGSYGVKYATVSTSTTPHDTQCRKSKNWLSRCCWYNSHLKWLVQSNSYCKLHFFNETKIISATPVLPYTCEKQESNKIISTVFPFPHSLLSRGGKAFQPENNQ